MDHTERQGRQAPFTVAHWQIVTKEPERIAQFYGDLCGWEFSTANRLGYRSLDGKSGAGIDGGIWPAPPDSPEIVQLYLEVPDIDHVLARVGALGGTVLMPKQILPDGDAMALVMDPLGRSFGLMTRKR